MLKMANIIFSEVRDVSSLSMTTVLSLGNFEVPALSELDSVSATRLISTLVKSTRNPLHRINTELALSSDRWKHKRHSKVPLKRRDLAGLIARFGTLAW